MSSVAIVAGVGGSEASTARAVSTALAIVGVSGPGRGGQYAGHVATMVLEVWLLSLWCWAEYSAHLQP